MTDTTLYDKVREELTEEFCNIMLGERIPFPIYNDNGETLIPANRLITKTLLRRFSHCCVPGFIFHNSDPNPLSNKIESIVNNFRSRYDHKINKRLPFCLREPQFNDLLSSLKLATKYIALRTNHASKENTETALGMKSQTIQTLIDILEEQRDFMMK